jgi:formylglycine-generating enzyme required for sulfatase activity
MRRFLQHPLEWLALAAVGAGLGLLHVPESAPAAADKLPKVEPSKHEKYTEKVPDSKLTFDMVPIPGGTFLMGSPDSEKGRTEEEGPQHPVTIKPFWMGRCEVTWDEYNTWWKDSPGNKQAQRDAEANKASQKEIDALSRPTPAYADETFGRGGSGHPVLGITHHAAMEYCRWLSQKTGKAYRLPTEAEWEWACRAGTTTAYSFGDDPKQLSEYACFTDNSDDKTFAVGSKKPNPWGLYDVHGNVAEWCLDLYKKDAYAGFALDKPTLGPVILPTEARFSHVARGGSWIDDAAGLRSAARRGSEKAWIQQDPQSPRSIWWLTDGDFVGFRVVRAVEEQDNLKGIRSQTKWTSK